MPSYPWAARANLTQGVSLVYNGDEAWRSREVCLRLLIASEREPEAPLAQHAGTKQPRGVVKVDFGVAMKGK